MRLALTILLLGTWMNSGAQHLYDNNWIFGYKCGLNFSTSPPQPILESQLISWEGCASISNTFGQLLFYTNGITVWNKNHQVMENGTGLRIGSYIPSFGSSSTQGVLILPSLTDTNQFLIFTQNSHPDTGICLSTVDITFNGGLGKVVDKNQPAYQGHSFSEKLTACRHANGRDWWLVSLKSSSNQYSVLLYSPQGIALDHVDTVGSVVYYLGQMTLSKTGTFLAVVSPLGKTNVLNFDRCTGHLSMNTSLGFNEGSNFHSNSFYGACFSSDESKLYLTPYEGQTLIQISFDTSTNSFTGLDTIWQNASIDTNASGMCARLYLNQMQLAKDEKIYCSFSSICSEPSQFDSYAHFLCVIDSPNAVGLSCDFQSTSVFIGDTPHYLLAGLPNMPNYNLGKLVGSSCDTLHVSVPSSPTLNHSFELYPNPVDDNEFTLKVNAPDAGELTMVVSDVWGRVLVTKPLPDKKKSYQVNKNLTSGAYHCTILDNDKLVRTMPFIVINE